MPCAFAVAGMGAYADATRAERGKARARPLAKATELRVGRPKAEWVPNILSEALQQTAGRQSHMMTLVADRCAWRQVMHIV